jgi:hypothetical protein
VFSDCRHIAGHPAKITPGAHGCSGTSQLGAVLPVHRTEVTMAVNKPTGDSARKGAVRKRTQLKGKLMGKTAWTKRDKRGGEFMAVKKGETKFKGVRSER